MSMIRTASVITLYSFRVWETEDAFSLFGSIEILLICMNTECFFVHNRLLQKLLSQAAPYYTLCSDF